MVDISKFDFVDFGASTGGSIDFGRRILGGKRPLGIDIDPEKVARMQAEGFESLEADVTALDLQENSVRFVVMSHFLEHLPSLDEVRLALQSASRVASDFIFIQGPFFDADEYLKNCGLKFYWSDWSGHKCHLTTTMLTAVLDDLGLSDFELMYVGEVSDSDDPTIHPLASGRNQHEYHPDLHPEKPRRIFGPSLFREIVCLVKVGDMDGWNDLVKKVSDKRSAVSAAFAEVPQSRPGSEKMNGIVGPIEGRRINKVAVLLLQKRSWHYLNYLYLRDAVQRSGELDSAFIITAGYGLDGVALALEFPQTRFHLASHRDDRTRFRKAKEITVEWSLQNLVFEKPVAGEIPHQWGFELVALCGVLHLVDDPQMLIEEALQVSRRRLYATVPLAADSSREDEAASGFTGFTRADVEDLFPKGRVRGCYWSNSGVQFRNHLEGLSNDQIREASGRLMDEAWNDVIDAIPVSRAEAEGMSYLSDPLPGVEP